MLQPLLRRPQSSLRAAAFFANGVRTGLRNRSLHSMPQLTHEASFRENGIPGLMSKDSFSIAWTAYQQFLVDKLNLLTQDTEDADRDALTLVKTYAKSREGAHIFNYASMAHNNHFFFKCLSPHKVEMPRGLIADMTEGGSSPESLKLDFLAAASGQFGPGFVWLVSQKTTGLLRILCTYNAGTPYSEAFARQQPVDMNNEPAPSTTRKVGWYQHAPFAEGGAPVDLAPGGIDVTPLLCVNTWEHAWLYDYGFHGKDEYLENWWDSVNWNEVDNTYREAPGYGARLNSRTL